MKALTIFLTLSLVSTTTPAKPPNQPELTTLLRDYSQIHSGLEAYKSQAKRYPTDKQGLQALVIKPTVPPIPKRWIASLKELQHDPWGTQYQYRFPGKRAAKYPEIISAGADKKFNTRDDISSQDPAILKLITQSAKIETTKSYFAALRSGLDMYKINGKRYPTEEQGLAALTKKPTIPPIPRRWAQTVQKMPQDAWGTAFSYKYPGTHDPSLPELISAGPDKKFGTADDLSSQRRE